MSDPASINEAVDVSVEKDGGVMKKVLVEGEGDVIAANCLVKVYYEGTLVDGTPFDSNTSGPGFEFTLGKGSVIKGWEIGVASMRLNEKAIFTLSSDYAYGAQGSPPKIPPNATLLFTVTLLSAIPKMTTLEKVEYGTPIKAEGNALWAKGAKEEAFDKWQEVLGLFDDGEGLTLPDEDWAKVNALITACSLNQAGVYASDKNWAGVLHCAGKAIEDNENHPKAHFRRGQAYAGLNDFTAAKKDLLLAAKLAPNDKAIRRELANVQTKAKAYRATEARRAKAMLGSGGLYDDLPDRAVVAESVEDALGDGSDEDSDAADAADATEASEKEKSVEVSEIVVGARPEDVWRIIGDFGDLSWHPEVVHSHGIVHTPSSSSSSPSSPSSPSTLSSEVVLGTLRRFVGSAGSTHTQSLTGWDLNKREVKVEDVKVDPGLGYTGMRHVVRVWETETGANVRYRVSFVVDPGVDVVDVAAECRRMIGRALQGIRSTLGLRLHTTDPDPTIMN